MTLRVLGLSGKAGSGKDYIAANYLKPLGFLPIALADAIKEEAVARGLCTYEEAFHTKPPHVRDLLQQLGTELGRDQYGEDIWCRRTHARMQRMAEQWGFTKFVITDVRFRNEVRFVQQEMGGEVLRVFAPDRVANNGMPDELRTHRSEIDLDPFDPTWNGERWVTEDESIKFDALIDNRHDQAHTVDFQMTHTLRVLDVIAPTEQVECDASNSRRAQRDAAFLEMIREAGYHEATEAPVPSRPTTMEMIEALVDIADETRGTVAEERQSLGDLT